VMDCHPDGSGHHPQRREQKRVVGHGG
jgi:hypothetical protein